LRVPSECPESIARKEKRVARNDRGVQQNSGGPRYSKCQTRH